MRVVLCTMGGSPGAAVLRTLLSSPDIRVAGIVRSTRWDTWRRLRGSGVRYTAYLGCTMLHRLDGHPVHATRDCNDAPTRAFIERLDPELVVTAFFNQRLLTSRAAVNIHPSLLPALRGVDPVFYAMLRNAPLGVSVHRLTPELDAGPLVAQREAPRAAGESVLGATARLYALGARLLLDSLPKLQVAEPQRGVPGYDSWPAPREVAALRRSGVRLVSWRDLLRRAP